MKTLKLTGIFTILLIVVAGCKKGVFCEKQDGNLVIQERDESGFDKVSVEIGANIEFTQAEKYAISIEASENLMDMIVTEVKGSELIIKERKKGCVRDWGVVNIKISLPELRAIDVSGSAEVRIPDEFETSELTCDVSGSGKFHIENLKTEKLDLEISGSADFQGGSQHTLEEIKVSISGSGKLLLREMPTHKMEIDISGSANAEVHVIEKLDVSISGSGNIRYEGSPVIDQKISGSGEVEPF